MRGKEPSALYVVEEAHEDENVVIEAEARDIAPFFELIDIVAIAVVSHFAHEFSDVDGPGQGATFEKSIIAQPEENIQLLVRPIDGADGDSAFAEEVEPLANYGHAAIGRHPDPEEPIAASFKLANFGKYIGGDGRAAEDDARGVVEDVEPTEEIADEAHPIAHEHPTLSGPAVVGHVDTHPILVDTVGARLAYYDVGVGVDDLDTLLEEVRGGVVVGLGNPDKVALGEGEAFFPLMEYTSAVLLVYADGRDAGVGAVGFDNGAAVVGTRVVEEYEFKIGICLREDGVEALVEVSGVVVVGADDGDARLMR